MPVVVIGVILLLLAVAFSQALATVILIVGVVAVMGLILSILDG